MRIVILNTLLVSCFVSSAVVCAQESVSSENNIYDSYFEATKPVGNVLGNQLNKFSDALLRQTTIGQRAQQAKEQQQLKRDVQTKRVVRSVKDCIKPNGLIDDEVQMCVNGTREKNLVATEFICKLGLY